MLSDFIIGCHAIVFPSGPLTGGLKCRAHTHTLSGTYTELLTNHKKFNILPTPNFIKDEKEEARTGGEQLRV